MNSLDIILERHSVRSYADTPLSPEEVNAIRAQISDINSHVPAAHFQFFTDDDSPFRGGMGSYGIFRNARNYVAAVVDTGVANALELAGYAGEQIVLRATELGLGSCFVGGTFDNNKMPVQLRVGWKTVFIITLGHPEGKKRMGEKIIYSLSHRRKMEPADFYDSGRSAVPLDRAEEMYPAFRNALTAVAAAPTAMNRREVRIWIGSDNMIHASVPEMTGFQPIDLGIAKYNLRQIIPGEWDFGNDAPFFPDTPPQ